MRTAVLAARLRAPPHSSYATNRATPACRRSARIPSPFPARLQAAGGCMTAEDVAQHTGAWVDPLRARFRDLEILEMPPPTQGVMALEAMRIADGLDLGSDGPDRWHLLIEALKLAFADR